ncbi:MAG: hypothetical protein NUV32_09220 [Exilispira sp.]|jgi:arsenate reductase|nr:hypothetical protein [Exilispira sp.]
MGKCSLFPGIISRLNWNFEDPSTFQGTDEQKKEKIKIVRDKIKSKVEQFVKDILNNT